MILYDTAANYSLRDDTGASYINFYGLIDGAGLLDDTGDNNSLLVDT